MNKCHLNSWCGNISLWKPTKKCIEYNFLRYRIVRHFSMVTSLVNTRVALQMRFCKYCSCCNMCLCVLYLVLHKVCNVFIDVVYAQLWCVWSNRREFLSCVEQMRSESCVFVPSPQECHIMGSRAWQKTPLRFVSYQTEIDLALLRFSYPEFPGPLLTQMLKRFHQSLFLGCFVKLLWNNESGIFSRSVLKISWDVKFVFKQSNRWLWDIVLR